MPLAPAYHESLPYIDPEPSPDALAAARALIAEEQSTIPPPSSNPPPAPSTLTPALAAELARVASSTPSAPLDLTRYEAPSTPADPSSLRAALSRAAASGAYLSSRAQELRLLDAWGKNAWLLGNHELEAELRALEAELAAAKAEIDVVNLQRRRRQEDVGGEVEALEAAWRKGVGRALETEVAVEEVRREIREELRRRVAQEVGSEAR